MSERACEICDFYDPGCAYCQRDKLVGVVCRSYEVNPLRQRILELKSKLAECEAKLKEAESWRDAFNKESAYFANMAEQQVYEASKYQQRAGKAEADLADCHTKLKEAENALQHSLWPDGDGRYFALSAEIIGQVLNELSTVALEDELPLDTVKRLAALRERVEKSEVIVISNMDEGVFTDAKAIYRIADGLALGKSARVALVRLPDEEGESHG